MQLVDDDAAEAREESRRILVGEEKGKRLGCREQKLRRRSPLALALRLRRVAGARLGADGECHLGDRLLEVAVDVDGKRLQGRDVKRVEPLLRLPGKLDERGKEAGERLSSARGGDEERGLAARGGRQHLELMRVRPPAAPGEPSGEGLREIDDRWSGRAHARDHSAVLEAGKEPRGARLGNFAAHAALDRETP